MPGGKTKDELLQYRERYRQEHKKEVKAQKRPTTAKIKSDCVSTGKPIT
jgi:hypothetical protein